MAHPPQGHPSSRRFRFEAAKPPLVPDPFVTAVSRYTDPANPKGVVSLRPTLTRPASTEVEAAEEGAQVNEPPPADVPQRPPSASAAVSRRRPRPPSVAAGRRPASARRANEPFVRSLVRAAETPALDKDAEYILGPGTAQASSPALAIKPRQLQTRPQSASSNGMAQQHQQDWLAKTMTLQRVHPSAKTPRNSTELPTAGGMRPRTAHSRLTRPDGEGGPRPSSAISIRISGEGLEDDVGSRSRKSSRRDGSSSARKPWQPSPVEWRHVARLSAARGAYPPAATPRSEAALTPGRGQKDTFSHQMQQAQMAQRTPLAVSTLDPDLLQSAAADFIKPDDSFAPPTMPLFASVKRPPKASAQVLSSFYDEAAAAGLLVGGAKGARGASTRAQLTLEGTADKEGTAASRSGTRSPRQGVSYQRQPFLWTRPISVDGPELALALAQAPPLA